MVKFVPVDPREVQAIKAGHRGRLSAQMLEEFMEADMWIAEIPQSEIEGKTSSLVAALGTYAKNHDIPVKAFLRRNRAFLLRLDIDDQGNPTGWKPNHLMNGNNRYYTDTTAEADAEAEAEAEELDPELEQEFGKGEYEAQGELATPPITPHEIRRKAAQVSRRP